jgi:hypothetical protein
MDGSHHFSVGVAPPKGMILTGAYDPSQGQEILRHLYIYIYIYYLLYFIAYILCN